MQQRQPAEPEPRLSGQSQRPSLSKDDHTIKNPTRGKLGPTWEGPYKVIHYSRRGSYLLKDLDGNKLPRPWNVEHLKRYYK